MKMHHFTIWAAICILAVASIAARAAAPWADPALPVTEGLELWLDASAQERAHKANGQGVLTPRGALNAWYDGSGHQRHAIQHDRDARPKYMRFGDLAAARFDGADDFFTSTGIPSELKELTVFLLAAPRANPGFFRAFFSAAAAGRNDYVSGVNIDMGPRETTSFETLNAEGAGFGGAHNFLRRGGTFDRFQVITLTVSPKEAAVHLDGRRGARQRTPAPMKLDTMVIGARLYAHGKDAPFVQGFINGDIAEVLVYSRALEPQQREQVETYLAAKRDALHREIAQGQSGFMIEPVTNAPPVQMLVPGFTVKKLSLDLTNINNLAYRPDGKLVALAYNGNVWLLSDSDSDGLEDKADLFWKNDGTVDRAIGMALTPPGYKHGQGVFFASKSRVLLVTDTDGDDRADERIAVAEGWTPSAHGVDALGVAVGPDGCIYYGRGTANFVAPYLIEKESGRSKYDLHDERGTILRISPDFAKREIVCTGIRYPVGMAFNQHGDLFCTDQEGATWVPNGNPFDELLHIQPGAGRHYGFPARHPKHLPGVIDEPSVFDYGPQHQSTCGIHFNTTGFGPDWWAGDAIIAGESRGKIYRTKLVKTDVGYVAQNQLIATLGMLTIDACPSPDGNLVVACHSGAPDWGTGPTGKGTLYKIIYSDKAHAQPVRAWAQSPTEVRIAFDRPLDPAHLTNLAKQVSITYGEGVRAGDRFETIWPGYAIVERQRSTPRFNLAVHSVQVSPDRRTLIVATEHHPRAADYAITLPGFGRPTTQNDGELPQIPAIDLDYTLHGIEAAWDSASGKWSGWLPHPNLAVSRALTTPSAEHEALWSSLKQPGRLTLRGQMDLKDMLRPAVQPGSGIDFEYPPEVVTLTFHGSAPIRVRVADKTAASTLVDGSHVATLQVGPGSDKPVPFEIMLDSDSSNGELSLDVTFHTAEDDRPRALPLRRFLLPWASTDTRKEIPGVARHIPQIEGGDWARGRELFYSDRAMCSKCHTVGDKGGRIGPDLSNLIHRDYASVFRDIEQPSAAINPDHIAYLFTLSDGRTMVGVPRSLPDGRTVIGDMAGIETIVTPSEIVAMRPQPISAMPPGLNHALGAEAFRDLMTFLLTAPLEPAKLEGDHQPPPARTRAEVQAVLDAGKAEADAKPQAAATPMHVVLVAGPKDHGPDEHDYPAWQQRWVKLLGLAENVTVTTASPFPTAEQFAKADVVIFYQKGEWTSERAALIDAYLERGGGLVYLHYAVDAGKEPQEFAQRIGLAWQGGRSKFRHGDLDLTFTDHPITAGFPSPTHFVDESYWQLVGTPGSVNVLATGEEDGAAQPLIWTRQVGENSGRVFVSILGHYTWTLDDPLFRALVLRGASWAAKQPIDRLSNLATIGARIESK